MTGNARRRSRGSGEEAPVQRNSRSLPAQGEPAVRRFAPVPSAVSAVAAWSWRVLIIAIAITAAVMVLTQLKTVVVPILVAVLLASLLAPAVAWLSRRLHVPRTLSVVASLVLVAAALAGLLTLAGTSIANGVEDLADRALAGFEEVLGWLSTGPLHLSPETLDAWVERFETQVQANSERILTGAMSITTSVGHVVAGTLIALFCLFFFLREGRGIWTWLVRLFPRTARDRVDGAGLRAWTSLGAYARTQIMVAFIDAVGIGLGAMILGVPLALPLAVIVFVGSFIPIVGAIATGSIAVAVALVDQGPIRALLMLAIVVAVQLVESHLLQPILMSKALRLHPVAVLLAVATGTLVGGIVGALFAVPFIAVLNTVLRYLNGNDPLAPELAAELDRQTWQAVRP